MSGVFVTEIKRHLNKPTETYRCRVLRREPGHLVVAYRTDREWRVGETAIPAGSVTIAHYWSERRYVLWHMLGPDRGLLGHLVHFCTPPEIREETVEYTDLILDVWFRPDGSHLVLDADELAAARDQGRLSPEEAARIEAECQAVIAEWSRPAPPAAMVARAFAEGWPAAVIGGVTVEPALVLAPMAGVTNWPFRLLCREQGCGLVCSEMVSANGLVHGNRRTRDFLAMAERERPVSIQLFGAEPETMAEAARIVAACEPDLIDINMGCPVPKVVATGAGAVLLDDLERAQRMVRAAAGATAIPVTVKMRAGWRGGREVAVEMARRAEEAGAAAVTIHPVAGRGGRGPDWSLIARVKDAVGIPVIGNGGVRTPQDAGRMLAETGCDAVMVGRAALGNPWVFGQIAHYLRTGEASPAPDLGQRVEMASRHGRLLIEAMGEERAVREMRKHLTWYLRGFPEAARWRERVCALTRWDDAEALLGRLAALAPSPDCDHAMREGGDAG